MATLVLIGLGMSVLISCASSTVDANPARTIDVSPYLINPPTTTTTTYPPVVGRCPNLEPLLADYGLPIELSRIAYRESLCNESAVNARWDENGVLIWTLNKGGTIDRGILQVNSMHVDIVETECGTRNLDILYSVDCNLKVAKYLYERGGLNHWRATSGKP